MPTDDFAVPSIGERIQTIRTRTGKSRAVVAGLVGRSEEWLRDVERGRQGAPASRCCSRSAERSVCEISPS